MAMDIFSSGVMKILMSPLIWMAIVLLLGLVSLGFLWFKKRMKLNLHLIIVTDLGDRKKNFELTKAGWFRKKSILFGLIDWDGERVMKTADNRRVQGAGSTDFHEFNGKSCLIVQRKSDDPTVLLPIRSIRLDEKSNELMAAIAPADYRDASNEILKGATSEMKGKWDKIMEWVILGGIIIFALVSIIIISQMVTKSQTTASDLIKEVAQKCTCTGASFASPASSGAP